MAKKRGPKGALSRREAVRQALTAVGQDASRSEIQAYVKQKYGYDMSLDHISASKSEVLKKHGGKAPPAAKAHKTAGGIGLHDIQAVKTLVGRVGATELKSLIDVLGK